MTQQFDLFVSPEAAPVKVTGSAEMKRYSPAALSEDDVVRHLQETARYRILKSSSLVLSRRQRERDFH
jgi:DNA polymerase-3 subunit epsilon